MKQIIVLSAYNVGFGGNHYLSIMGGGDATNSFGINLARLPLPIDCTVRNLGVAGYTAHNSRTYTLLKDNVATALAVTLSSAATGPVMDESDDIAVVAGEDVSIGFDGGSGGHEIVYTLELEAAQHVYGAHICKAGMDSAGVRDTPALGNTTWSGSGAVGSICAVAGTLTTMRVKSYDDPPGAGTLTVTLVVDAVLQDGSGATVDTRCVLSGSDTEGTVTFTLPIAVQQKVGLRLNRSGVAINVQIAVGLAFTPDDGASFMLVGGSNQTVGTYIWNKSEQGITDITEAMAVVGPFGLVARGLYAEMRTGMASGDSRTVTLLKNNNPTAISFAITYAADPVVPHVGSVTGSVEFVSGDTIVIALPQGSSGQFHWGLAAYAGDDGVDEDEDELPRIGPDPDEREIHVGPDARGIWVRPDILLRKGLINDPGPRELPIGRGQ